MNRANPIRLSALGLGMALAAMLVARGALFSAFSIPSSSMRPTLEVGDHVLVTPYRQLWRRVLPARGDVIVFRSPLDPNYFYTKRIVAVPGDVLEIRKGRARINGVTLSESYVADPVRSGDRGAEIIGVGRYFVMGDHRSDSFDSRAWGTLPGSLIVGRARIIFWSAEDSTHSPQARASTGHQSSGPSGSSIRWSRLLTVIR